MTCGIYKITNKINGKAYIGASKNINRRWNEHLRENGTRVSKIIHEIGKNNFTFTILKECSFEELYVEEIKFIEKYDTLEPNGYNLTKGGEHHHNTTGYYRVCKCNSPNLSQGFSWAYVYIDNNKYRRINSVDLDILKENVINKGLEWKIIDKEKAELSDRVNKKNKDINHTRDNKTGYYRVSKNIDENMDQGYSWKYQYIENGEKKAISRTNFLELEKIVKSKNLPWMIIDEENAKETLNQIIEDNKMYNNGNPNFTGFYRVYTKKEKEVTQGFIFKYDFREDDGHRRIISNVDLNNLKEKVKSEGLPWYIVDKDKAEETVELNRRYEKFHGPYSSTGFLRVSKEYGNSFKKGYRWCYQYRDEVSKKNRKVSSVDLMKLKEKVINQGLDWLVTDDDLAKKTLDEEYGVDFESNVQSTLI
ncbi:MAG: GIY-YIG nuclease family protein [Methanobrevibacter sp.]|nr:GIY-YIG nuclease family protein [Methanosphaera sp.]MBR0371040.1 GIY-YIG nuclease family protein [Methanobrevibacter sp.]